jgi:hypothetical protein
MRGGKNYNVEVSLINFGRAPTAGGVESCDAKTNAG